MKNKEKKYSKKIVHAINCFLKSDNWPFSFDKKKGIYRLELQLNNKVKKIFYEIKVKKKEYVVYTYFPIGVNERDEAMMSIMAEFICRANYGLKNGNFELDMDDGEICFKYFVDFTDMIPAEETIRNSIYCPALMCEWYAPGVEKIIFCHYEAKEAIELCERITEEKIKFFQNIGCGEL